MGNIQSPKIQNEKFAKKDKTKWTEKDKRMETTVTGIQTVVQIRVTKQTAKKFFYSATF